jgi:hypothetical protein
MKKISIAFFCLLIVGLCFTGCKKEEESVNYFQVGDKIYNISQGDLEYYGGQDKWSLIGMNLLTEGLTLDEGGYWNNSGTGINFVFVSSASDGLPTGDYKYDDNYPVFSIYFICYCLDWKDVVELNDWDYITSGNVSIKRKGDNYVIKFNGIDNHSNILKAYFSGTFDMYDFSGEKGAGSHR